MARLYNDLNELTALRFHVKHRRLVRQQKLVSQKGGAHQAVRKGRGMTFSEVREYQPGDDVRHIDWKVTARQQKAHTKVFTEELEKPVIALCEQTPVMFFGSQVRFKSVQALNLATALGWITLHQGDRFGGWGFNAQTHAFTPPKHQHRSLMRFIQQTQHLQTALKAPGLPDPLAWTRQLEALSPSLRPGSRLILIGHLLDQPDAFFARLRQLQKHQQLDLIHVFDPLECDLPFNGMLSVTDGQTQTQLNSQSDRVHQAWRSGFDQAWSKLEARCRQLHFPLMAINGQQDPVTALQQAGMIR
ncbi:DUF58 domain-containing protein [Thiomicrospira sp. WB1]|uniref:DUF58 domain-containing protein n=1 Tax=Thiomicrospira sp. WB1 TaxID=1685380 RepID=UPI00074AF86F|nr:DUF58 domain-containing protein [Thiomicrospira sp. WB1]KUJ72267.1 hypothetical protein AVO41_00135 [Thiomicrospira sp. WB1]